MLLKPSVILASRVNAATQKQIFEMIVKRGNLVLAELPNADLALVVKLVKLESIPVLAVKLGRLSLTMNALPANLESIITAGAKIVYLVKPQNILALLPVRNQNKNAVKLLVLPVVSVSELLV